MVIIEPYGGLSNRLRVIASGLWLSSIKGDKLSLIWDRRPELNCNYNALFLLVPEINEINRKIHHKFIRSSYQSNYPKQFVVNLINKLLGIDLCITDRFIKDYLHSNKIDLKSIFTKNQVIYYRGCEEFANDTSYYSYFKPTLEIQEKINSQIEKFNSSTIGIHIRRTDNVVSIINSPLKLFIDIIENCLALNNKTNFFLSTDDATIEVKFKEKYGSKIFAINKVFDRSTEEGIKDAVVDMFCLASTNKIYGSYWSSFSYVASKIGKIELSILKI